MIIRFEMKIDTSFDSSINCRSTGITSCEQSSEPCYGILDYLPNDAIEGKWLMKMDILMVVQFDVPNANRKIAK